MPNNYFRFRQFTVHQDKSAMKVCTDACLFGAWVASVIQNQNVKRGLDIGTGTGLLSLMIAQASSATIDAVEIDENAFQQAQENFKASPWQERLTAHHADIKDFEPTAKYNLIFCNPPFYENDLLSDDERRNVALHSTSFTLDDLLQTAEKLLNKHGRLAILLPYRRRNDLEKKVSSGPFNISEKVTVKQTPRHSGFRCMYILELSAGGEPRQREITIKSGDMYTEDFSSLLKDYYL